VESDYKSSYSFHAIRVLVVMAILLLCVVTARALFIPENFEKHGQHLIGAVIDEMNRLIRNQTNGSCLACSPNVKQVHLEGFHKTVSCEFCHGPNADHVRDKKKIADMTVSNLFTSQMGFL